MSTKIQIFVSYDVVTDFAANSTFFEPFYLENDKHYEKKYTIKIVQDNQHFLH